MQCETRFAVETVYRPYEKTDILCPLSFEQKQYDTVIKTSNRYSGIPHPYHYIKACSKTFLLLPPCVVPNICAANRRCSNILMQRPRKIFLKACCIFMLPVV